MNDTENPSFANPPFIARWLKDEGATFVITRTLLLRLLGIVYFVVFLSLLLQGPALIGERGLLPMRDFLHAVARTSGSATAGFLDAPSVFWVSPSNVMLVVVSIAGMMLSAAVILGVTNAAVMIVLWTLQLSIHSVGQIFWGYGWEIQLLETGMLAAVMCPLGNWRESFSSHKPPIASIWLMRWLVVRIMLGAGLIKMRGDPCWRELTCLITHYETQPNPSPLSWVFHQLPPWAHMLGVLFNHFVELVCPFFLIGPRVMRRVAGCFFVAFQAVLIASGNLSFLNWLTIVPALACFDDAFLTRLIPRKLRGIATHAISGAKPPSKWHRRIAISYAVIVGFLSINPVVNLLSSRQAMNASFDPLHLVNTYGAFGSVNAVRDEIVLEGTRSETPSDDDDDDSWQAYELPCKPGDVMRRPCLISPYHYRLDWQMWFASMSSYEEEPWIVVLADKLLHGDSAVFPLLEKNPFPNPNEPPRYIRARMYRYEFTRRGEAGWWRRRLLTPADRPGAPEYLRPLKLGDPGLEDFIAGHRLW